MSSQAAAAAGTPASDGVSRSAAPDRTGHGAGREQLLAELTAERARLRAVIDHLPAAVIVCEAPSGRIVLANGNVNTVFPRLAGPFPRDIRELFAAWPAVHADGRPVAEHELPLSRALRGESVEGEDYRFVFDGGEERWINLSAAPIRDESGAVTGAVAISSDVDRQRRADDALRASELRHRQIFDSPVIGIVHASLDGPILDANERFLRTFGYTREDLAAGRLDWRTLTPPEYRELDDAKVQDLRTRGSHPVYEKEYVRKDGARVPIVVGSTMLAGSATELIAFVLDITERKRADAEREALLRTVEESEERYRLAARASSDTIYDWDLRTDRVDLDATHGDLGGAVSDAAAWRDRIHPDDRERVVSSVRAAIESGARRWEEEYRVRAADGSWAVVADRGYVTYDEEGPARVVGATRDVTARRRQEEFERQLIGIVSHDLRSPLATISLAAGMMARTAGADERTLRNVRRIQDAAERASRMIRDLLDFTRARLGGGIPVERRDVDLDQVFRAIVDDVRAGRPSRSIVFESSGDCRGAFDPDRLAQVLTNLLDNALKYGPAGSPVRVTLTGEPDDVRLAVHNDGPAIPADLLPRIFEPLQRGEAAFDVAGRSIGLGLYIVKSLVEAHDGTVEVRSSDREGTEIAARLPRSPSAPRR